MISCFHGDGPKAATHFGIPSLGLTSMDFIDDVGLIIFDCDGVVADSEPLAIRVMQEGLARLGVFLTFDEVVDRFLGRSPETIGKTLLSDFNLVLDAETTEAMRLRLFQLFRSDLRAIEGVEAFLSSLPVPYCLASSSQMERIEIALDATALTRHFSGRIFNAAMVSRGKPAPDLFLHAAAALGFAPEQCVVIEDSPAGIEAGKRAGMRVIGFTGGGHARSAAHRRTIAALQPDYISESMAEVASLFRFNATLGA